MFNNIGGKIKILATVITVVGIIASFISGLILIADGNNDIPIITGFFVLYGLGQLIENTDAIRAHMTGSANIPAVKAPVAPYFCTNCGHPGPFSGNCPKCGSRRTHQNPEMNPAFRKADNTVPPFISNSPNAPYWCSDCGHPGPYDGNCPSCGSEYIYEYDKSQSKGLK